MVALFPPCRNGRFSSSRAIAYNKGIKIFFLIPCHLFSIFKTDVTLRSITNYYKYVNNDCDVFHLASFPEYPLLELV